MTHHSSPLLDSDVLDCLRTDVVPSSAEAKRRISTRLSVSVGALLSAGAPTPSVETTIAPHVRPLGAARNWSRLLARRPWGLTVATFSIGAVCGAGITPRFTTVPLQELPKRCSLSPRRRLP